jgi:FKBP-type peptidyl-prolyl cis-trans isomerase
MMISSARGPTFVALLTQLCLIGWDEGVPQMSLGEKAILDISS